MSSATWTYSGVLTITQRARALTNDAHEGDLMRGACLSFGSCAANGGRRANRRGGSGSRQENCRGHAGVPRIQDNASHELFASCRTVRAGTVAAEPYDEGFSLESVWHGRGFENQTTERDRLDVDDSDEAADRVEVNDDVDALPVRISTRCQKATPSARCK
jgi:hypothetical protein